MDKKIIDLYTGEHTEDRGKTSENDVSEVIPVKEPEKVLDEDLCIEDRIGNYLGEFILFKGSLELSL